MYDDGKGFFMTKLIINGDYLAFSTPAGVTRFATELLRELDNINVSLNIELIAPEYVKILPQFKTIQVKKHGRLPLLIWKQLTLPCYVKKNKGLLLDLTQAFPLYRNKITCVHDCIPELVQSAYTGVVGKRIRKPIKLLQRRISIKNSRMILTVSQFSKEDILKTYHIAEDKIRVIPNAWQHIKRTPYDNEIIYNLGIQNRPFYFCLGSRVPHKNIEWIKAAAEQNADDIFIVSGENRYEKNFDFKRFPSNIVFTGFISDGEIRSLMAKCKAFIFPSLYEGFGIPPMEALAENSEIIISNIPCLTSIYGKTAHYINPQEYNNIDLRRILTTAVSSSRDLLEKYSWHKSAVILYDVIRREII